VNHARLAALGACAVLGVLSILAVNRSARFGRDASASASPDNREETYPHGRWRLDPASLNNVLLSFEEILVSHREARRPPGPMTDPQTRTRREALARAREIAERARANPETFQALARRHSDDSVNAPWGGASGVVRAPLVDAPVLDALAALSIGEVSRVFESAEGFHVIKRLGVPPDERLAAARIVIKYQGSAGTPRPGITISRTREQARSLGELMASDLKGNPGAFDAMVEQHSEEYDVSGGGAMGSWSLHDGGSWALLLHAISTVPVGAVSDLVETAEGFNILKRTAPAPPVRWAVTELVISYSDAPERPQGRVIPRSRDEAKALATRLASQLGEHPEGMKVALSQYCDLEPCPDTPAPWEPGRNLASLDRAVATLQVHGITREPIETPIGFHLLRRDDPSTLPLPNQEPVSFEMPEPAFKDLGFIITRASGRQLASGTRRLAADAARGLELAPAEAKQLTSLLEGLASTFESAPVDSRRASFEAVDARIKELLGAERHRTFRQFLERWLAQMQLQ
jgi:hypothetical protein